MAPMFDFKKYEMNSHRVKMPHAVSIKISFDVRERQEQVEKISVWLSENIQGTWCLNPHGAAMPKNNGLYFFSN